MIDEKKLIEELKFQINNCETYGHSDIYIDLEMAKKWVETIEKKKVGEWIPCSERLPEDNQAVLTCKNKHISILEYHADTKHWFETKGNWWWSFNMVDAWMPLPEPYKKVEE